MRVKASDGIERTEPSRHTAGRASVPVFSKIRAMQPGQSGISLWNDLLPRCHPKLDLKGRCEPFVQHAKKEQLDEIWSRRG
jgi:hypothetical protein